MVKFNSHWKIVVIVTLLNVLGELAFRGFDFVASIGVIFFLYLFITYFTFAIICEYQIIKKRINDIGLYIGSFAVCLWWQILFPLAIFAPPRILGINWLIVLFVDILMWPFIQAVLFFYLARRLIPRKLDEPFINKYQFLASIAVFTLITIILHALFKFAGLANILGYIILIFMFLGIFTLYKKIINNPISEINNAHNSKFLDGMGVLVVFILVYCAFFVPLDSKTMNDVHIFNTNAFGILIATTIIIPLLLTLYRLITKKQIPV